MVLGELLFRCLTSKTEQKCKVISNKCSLNQTARTVTSYFYPTQCLFIVLFLPFYHLSLLVFSNISVCMLQAGASSMWASCCGLLNEVMGTGAVRGQQAGFGGGAGPFRFAQNTDFSPYPSSSSNIVCKACGLNFTVFRKKVRSCSVEFYIRVIQLRLTFVCTEYL